MHKNNDLCNHTGYTTWLPRMKLLIIWKIGSKEEFKYVLQWFYIPGHVHSKKLELNCAIGMVYSLKFFECSSATPSTEIDSKPDNYLE